MVVSEDMTIKKDKSIIEVVAVSDDSDYDRTTKAKIATEEAHQLTVIEAFKKFKYASFWAFFINLAVIMCGFDPSVIGSSVGIEQFRKTFGREYEGEYVIPAAWLSAFNYASYIGNIIGSIVVGYLIQWKGNRFAMVCGCSFITGTIFIQFFSATPPVLFVGELLSGIPIGMFPVIASVYTAEVSPLPLRGVFTAFVNLSFVIGQLLAAGVLSGTQDRDDVWSYKIPFAVQWIWPILILSLISFCPESPWWLVRKGRIEDAKKSLCKLSPDLVNDDTKLDNEIAVMQKTIELEHENISTEGYWECFKGTNLRRTIIACMVYCIQPLSGQVLIISYCVYFFENAGLNSSQAFGLNIGLSAIGFVGTLISWPLMHKLGRRNLYLMPMVFMTIIQLVIGFIDLPKNYGSKNAWAESILMLVWTFVYDISVGPLAFVYMAEVSSTKIREKVIAIANVAVVIVIIVFTVVVPYMINLDEGNLRGKAAFVFGGLCFLCFVWAFFELPETFNRTFEEVDLMFGLKLPARKFKKFDFKEYESNDQSDCP